jgi:hypothetical protein
VPTARARWAGGNEVVMTESVDGIANAAPTPAMLRAAMSRLGSSTTAPNA